VAYLEIGQGGGHNYKMDQRIGSPQAGSIGRAAVKVPGQSLRNWAISEI